MRSAVSDEGTVERYLDAVRREFAALKAAEGDDGRAGPIAIGRGDGLLVPVREPHTQDDELISTLSRWRSENARAFASRFPVTDEGTRRWLLSDVLAADDRVLFLVCGADGSPVGHIGIANALNERREMEIDNVLRGENSTPGLMSQAVQDLSHWASRTFPLSRLFLHVLSDNEHAIGFYRRLGWADRELIPLVREVDGARETLHPAPAGRPADAWFLRMVLERPPEAR
jgi:RimJ/RimL family protein N-acetyltransferase